jgi:glycosyltransferase involved in cell wall biosynthesis
VQFLGRQDDLEHFLPGCDLFLLPSESESFGLAALEAMACGVPAVGTRVGGLPEVIRPGVDGELCTPGDPDCLGATCVELLRDPALHARMQAAARARAVEQFALETIAPLYEQLYYEVAGA